MHIKTTLKFDLTPNRMAKIMKQPPTNTVNERESPLLVRCLTDAAIIETTVENSQKAKNKYYDPAILLLGICPKVSASYSTDTCPTVLFCSIHKS